MIGICSNYLLNRCSFDGRLFDYCFFIGHLYNKWFLLLFITFSTIEVIIALIVTDEFVVEILFAFENLELELKHHVLSGMSNQSPPGCWNQICFQEINICDTYTIQMIFNLFRLNCQHKCLNLASVTPNSRQFPSSFCCSRNSP